MQIMYCLFVHLEGNTRLLAMMEITRIAASFYYDTYSTSVTSSCLAAVVASVRIANSGGVFC